MFRKSLGILAAIALLPLFASSGEPRPWPQQITYDLATDPAVTFGHLPNGVRYAVMRNSEPPGRVSMRLHVEAGSAMETEQERGLAHFLEHMAFNGTRSHAPGQIVEFFQRLGMGFGNDTNAHTSWDETVYLLELPRTDDAMLDDAMRTMRDYADGMLLEEKEIDEERGIILAERLERDSVRYRMFVKAIAFAMPDSIIPLRMPIGEKEVIATADRERFLDFYRRWYTPSRMTLIVVGDLDPQKAMELVQKHFGNMDGMEAPDPGFGTVGERGRVFQVIREPEAPGVDISISCLRPASDVPDCAAMRGRELALDMACAILSQRLELLAKAENAPFIEGSAYCFRWLNFVENAEISLTCQPDKWRESLALAETELRRAIEHGFTQEEFDEEKARILNAAEEAVRRAPTRKSAALADQISATIGDARVFTSPEDDLALTRKILDKLSPEVLHMGIRAAWEYDTRITCASGCLPEGVDEAALAQALAESATKPVEPPQKQQAIQFAYTSFGPSGRVTSGRIVEDLGVHQMQFANNVCLNLKPTDFEKGGVRVLVRFGSGLLDEPKPGLHIVAADTFIAGGLEAHTSDELNRIFAGRTVGVAFGVGTDSFVLDGATSPADLGAQLELMAAYITAPGWREEAFRREYKALQQRYTDFEHSPDGILDRDFGRFMAGGDPRLGYPPLESILALDAEDVRKWLSPALATGRMEISIVGDFKVEDAIREAARTFGALPARQQYKPELADERRLTMPAAGDHTIQFQTTIPKAISVVAWPTADQWDVARARRLSILADVLSERLRVELREKMGDAYSPYAFSSTSDTFKDHGYVACISNVDAARVEEASALVRSVADDMAQNGITQDELDRALKPFMEAITQWRRNNRYWLGTVIGQSQEQPVRLDWSRSMVGDFSSITIEDIQNLAKQYLPQERAIILKIIPEAPEPAEAQPE